ncbi:MAG: hypothetical protein A2Z25_00900 [Planctomycetes bacterium RBG_16_55_9]|nr:MAG: hypothetical protein A2Z25_00900 [Planctomycetes bacterium RBG_16_55_9]
MLALPLASQSDHDKEITISLSNPNEPGYLSINHHKGSIHVTGCPGTSVIVKASTRFGTGGEPIHLGAVESNNHVVINATPRHRTIDLDIEVPHRFSLRLKNDDSGNITVEDLSGDLEISNINGDISLKDISGYAVLDTVDGDMIVQFKEVAPGLPMAFSSVEGNIDITFPKDINVLAKVKADSGYIVNDFNGETEAKKQQAPKRNGPGKTSYYTINDGGPEVLLRSFLGNIYIRQQQDN